jgi:hypothetical protein
MNNTNKINPKSAEEFFTVLSQSVSSKNDSIFFKSN